MIGIRVRALVCMVFYIRLTAVMILFGTIKLIGIRPELIGQSNIVRKIDGNFIQEPFHIIKTGVMADHGLLGNRLIIIQVRMKRTSIIRVVSGDKRG